MLLGPNGGQEWTQLEMSDRGEEIVSKTMKTGIPGYHIPRGIQGKNRGH